jgi:hypothetical protein
MTVEPEKAISASQAQGEKKRFLAKLDGFTHTTIRSKN